MPAPSFTVLLLMPPARRRKAFPGVSLGRHEFSFLVDEATAAGLGVKTHLRGAALQVGSRRLQLGAFVRAATRARLPSGEPGRKLTAVVMAITAGDLWRLNQLVSGAAPKRVPRRGIPFVRGTAAAAQGQPKTARATSPRRRVKRRA